MRHDNDRNLLTTGMRTFNVNKHLRKHHTRYFRDFETLVTSKNLRRNLKIKKCKMDRSTQKQHSKSMSRLLEEKRAKTIRSSPLTGYNKERNNNYAFKPQSILN